MKKLNLLLFAVLAFAVRANSQIITTSPSPLQESSQNVEIFFHADEGNKGLMGQPASESVYAHTGVEVVNNAGTVTSWKYAPEWGDNNPKYELVNVGENLWKLTIGDIRTYYNVAADEQVKRLCFVFRNADKTREGKDVGNEDIFVDVLDSGFQLSFRHNRLTDVITGSTNKLTFTASTTEDASISIRVGDNTIAETASAMSLVADYTFTEPGDYVVTAEAVKGDGKLSRSITVVYAKESAPAADTSVPAMGLTRNADGSYTFCLAAPGKESVMLVGSWNGYRPTNDNVMGYVNTEIDGGTFRFFKTTIPATVAGSEFCYYYLVDGRTSVGDPYARLVLDPQNDKYISAEVFPGLPEYPVDKVPSNTSLAYHRDGMLDYDWTATDFKAPAKTDLVIYEMLFRDFTGTEGQSRGNGTVRAAIEKIPYLKQLGVNAVELLPINEFNGNNSWGYNPNFYFAPDKAYGTPQDYKEFIDLCHKEGIAVILDVVFNQSDWQHPWFRMYQAGSNPFFNATAPHAYSVLNDWNQGYPLVERQWTDMLRFWLEEFRIDGFRFDLVKGLGDNDSYANSGDSGTNAYNKSRVERMKRLHAAMREVNPDAYFINENLATAKEENEMAEDGELNWANVNNAGCQFAMGYSSDSNLNRMYAVKDNRTAGSTVAYLESHDEQRLAYKQIKWGVAGVKDNHRVAMQRCGAAAAQMILVPGSHMIWMFSEMGNDQNTKDNNGGNNTSPKKVNWSLLDDPDNAGLVESYRSMIALRLSNPDLFGEEAQYSNLCQAWSAGRSITAVNGDKELYCVINPNVTGNITLSVDFLSADNNSYRVASKSYASSPSFDAAAKTVTVEPNCYVVLTSGSVAGIGNVTIGSEAGTVIYGAQGCVRVENATAPVTVYTLDGRVAGGAEASQAVEIALPAGAYAVRCGAEAAKVMVR